MIFQTLTPLFNFSTVENEVIVYQKVTGFANVFSVKNIVFRGFPPCYHKGSQLNLSLLTPSGGGEKVTWFLKKIKKFLRKVASFHFSNTS